MGQLQLRCHLCALLPIAVRNMDALKDWLTENRFGQFRDGLVKRLGVETVGDLVYATTADLDDLGFMPVQRRSFEQRPYLRLAAASSALVPVRKCSEQRKVRILKSPATYVNFLVG